MKLATDQEAIEVYKKRVQELEAALEGCYKSCPHEVSLIQTTEQNEGLREENGKLKEEIRRLENELELIKNHAKGWEEIFLFYVKKVKEFERMRRKND